MAIATDSYYNIVYNGEVVDTIGLSKALNQYTIDDIASMTFCGTQFLMAKNLSQREKGVTLLGWDLPKPFDVEDGQHIGNGGKYILDAGNSPYQYPDGAPFSVIWLSFGSGLFAPKYLSTNDTSLLPNIKIITEWDAPKFEYVITAPETKGGKGATAWSDPDSDLYTTPLYYNDGHDNTMKYRINNNVTVNIAPTGGPICPYMMTYINGIFILVQLNASNNQWYSRGNSTGAPWHPDGEVTGGGPWVNYQYTTSFGSSCNVATIAKNSFDGEAIAFPYTWYYSENYSGNDYGVPLTCFGYNDLGEPIQVNFSGAPADGYGGQRSVEVQCFCKNRDQIYKIIAGGGIKFVTDRTYKPIIQDGWVTGYTDDMSAESELDEWHGTTAHSVAPTPPTPPVPPTPEGDDMDVMNTGATGSSGGFTHFYIMSPQDLIDLLADFYARADAGETISNNLVCSYILGIPSSSWAATESVPVAIHNSAQGIPFVSNDNYNHVTATNNMLVTGTFDVPRMTNTFYDFSPYSTYEVFVPCCGWVRLPDTVAGRTINVYLYLDIASCCVKGQVMISGAGVCAVVNGALGSPIPMAVIESGILRGNNIQAGMGMIGGAIQTGVSAGNGNSMGIGLGAERILSGLVNCTVAGNTNYTEQKGGTGDITQFAMGHQCYMKITHPEIDPVVNEYIFGHTVGYLCNTVGTLSAFHGFTMCSNPHINISASDREREEIKQFLEQGVILP